MPYLEDLKFVLHEVARFRSMDFREIQELPLTEILSYLPQPSGSGMLICGSAAFERLHQVADIAIKHHRLTGRVAPESVFENLKFSIVDRFLRERRPLNTREADRTIGAAIRRTTETCTSLTHYIPCHIGHEKTPCEFAIGPVRFQHTNDVLKALNPKLRAYLRQNLEHDAEKSRASGRRHVSRTLVSQARKYYRSFGWIAQTETTGLDPATSRKQAERIVQSALDCLHLLIGASYSNHMRVGGPAFASDRRAAIRLNADKKIEISFHIDWLAHNLGDGWWEFVSKRGGPETLGLIGVAIKEGLAFPEPAPLSQRFLDAVSWYGEAVRDDFAASRLIKYVTAIERLLITKNETNLAEVLAERGSAMVFNPRNGSRDALKKRFRDVYDLRSRLVHGARSPFDVGLGRGLGEAEYLTRAVLFASLRFFGQEGLETKTVSNRKLEKELRALVKWRAESEHQA